MPRHCSANSPGEAIPATVRHRAAGSATTSWHCATHSRTADASHPRKRTAEPSKRRRTTTPRPCRSNAVTSGRRDQSPSALCNHPRRPRRHPGHCITIPDAVEACGDGTLPCQQLYPRTASRHGTLESSHGRPPNRRPLHRHPRSRSWTRHDAPPGARFARTAVYSATLYTTPLHVGEIVRHACKLPPPCPIKGGAVP
jgi:hypothetical protein